MKLKNKIVGFLTMLAMVIGLNAAPMWTGGVDFLGQPITLSPAPAGLDFSAPEGFPTNYVASRNYMSSLTSTNLNTIGWITLTTAKVEALHGEVGALSFVNNSTNISVGFRPYVLAQIYKITGNRAAYVSILQSALNIPTLEADNVIYFSKLQIEYLNKNGGDVKTKSDISKNALARAYQPKDLAACAMLFSRVNSSLYPIQDYVMWLKRVKANQILPTDTYKDSIPFLSTLQSAVLINDPTGIYK